MRKVAAVAISLLSLVGLGFMASPAGAETKKTTTVTDNECFVRRMSTSVCVSGTFTLKEIGSLDGKMFLVQGKIEKTTTSTRNGEVVSVLEERSSYMFKFKDGEEQLHKSKQITIDDDGCTSFFKTIVVKGELKVSKDSTTCV